MLGINPFYSGLVISPVEKLRYLNTRPDRHPGQLYSVDKHYYEPYALYINVHCVCACTLLLCEADCRHGTFVAHQLEASVLCPVNIKVVFCFSLKKQSKSPRHTLAVESSQFAVLLCCRILPEVFCF